MKIRFFIALFIAVGSFSLTLRGSDDARIILRGDANNDSTVNDSDAIYISNWLFQSGPEPPCMNQADADNDGEVDNSDIVYLMNWLHQGGPAPPSPGPYATECSDDDSPYPGCDVDLCE